ncbi:MAG: glycosyltransferase family 39 protein [Anaerolineales bacterium]
MSKKTAIILALMLLTSALLGSSVLTRGHWWGDDFAAYIMQAKSILAGNMGAFVAANTFTVTQSSHQIGPAAYPWGFPLILAPVYALIGLSPLALKLPGLLAYLGFLLVFFFLTKRRFTPTESLLAVSLFAFNPELLRFLDNIASDIPFLLFSTLTILLADLYAHETQAKRRLWLAALTGTAIFAAFFVRTQGLILLGSVLLFQGLRFLGQRAQRRQIVTDSLIILAAFGVLWGISVLIFPDGQSSYLALYAGFSLDILKGNIVAYSQTFGEFFATVPGGLLFFDIFVVLFFIGLVARFKADLLFVFYAVLYLIVLWTWPEWQGYRFLFPMLPFFIYFAIQGMRVTLAKVGENQKAVLQKGANVYLLLIVVPFAYISGSNAYANLRAGREINGPFDPYSIETYDFIKNNTPPDSVIVFFKPRAMRLMTDRITLALTECERMTEGDYLALSKKVGENLQIPPERIDECNLPLDKVFENRRFVVYRVMK